MVTAGATANTTEENSRASRESRLLRAHSHGEVCVHSHGEVFVFAVLTLRGQSRIRYSLPPPGCSESGIHLSSATGEPLGFLWIRVQGFIKWAKQSLESVFCSSLRGLPTQGPYHAFFCFIFSQLHDAFHPNWGRLFKAGH